MVGILRGPKAIDPNEFRRIEQELAEQEESLQEELAAILAAALLLGITTGGELAALLLSRGFDPNHPEVKRFIEDYKWHLARQIMDTTTEDIRRLIELAKTEEWAATRLRDELRHLFNQYIENRADLIAITEAVRSLNVGAAILYQLAGVQFHRWVTVHDDRTCPFCRVMDGKIVSIGQPFARLGETLKVNDEQSYTVGFMDVLTPPLHPRCRCVLIPVFEIPAT